MESRKGARPGPTGSRLFPFPAHQTGHAQLEHPAFRLVSPQRPTRRSDKTAPCDGTRVTPPSRCGNSLDGEHSEPRSFQSFVNDRSVALYPAQKQGSRNYPGHLSGMLRSLPRRIEQVHLSICSLSVLPSPVNGPVGIHDFTFGPAPASLALRPARLLARL